MLISFANKFIFVANTKTASNSIELLLKPYADIAILNPVIGKHDTLLLIRKNYSHIFERSSLEKFQFQSLLKFGVMREPISWVVSWYNYNSREQISNPNNRNYYSYTKNKSFKNYFEDHVINGNNIAFTGCQADKFVNYKNENEILSDNILIYENLNDEFNLIMKKLDIKLSKPLKSTKRNITKNKKLKKEDLTSADITMIKNFYQKDFIFYDQLLESKYRLS